METWPIYKLWEAGIRGKAFLLFRSYLELTIVAVIIEGCVSDPWESTLGLLQGSVLSMLLSALYLSSLQHLLEKATCTATGTAVRTNSRFYVDDGLLPAEIKQALQTLLDVVSQWIRLWRNRIRLATGQ